MTRFRTGWDLTKKSWHVLRSRPGLTAFPVLGGFVVALTAIVIAGPGFLLLDRNDTVAGAILIALGLYLTAFVGTFFAVALAAAADRALRGEEVTLGDGIAVARTRLGAIAGWAFISTVVSLIVNALQSQSSIGGAIVGVLGGAAWSLITFLAVPVIALEGLGPVATVKRSASLFRSRWKGQVTGNIAIGGIVFFLGVLPAVAMIVLGVLLWTSDPNGAGVAAGAVVTVIGVALLCVALVIASAIRQVFGVALYRYTADGSVLGEFTQGEFESAVKPHGRHATA